MAGTKNDVIVAKNADFSQAAAPNPQSSESNGLITNGQMWVGSTALNVGGTHVNVGSITSPSGSLLIGYSTPNITLEVAGGTTVGKTITGNTGGALAPTAGNWNIPGTNSALTGYSPWTTGSGSTLTLNMPGTVKWVVNATANLGTHTTIQAAITAASSGDDVFITAGTYTENLTLKAGVNLIGFSGDGSTPQVIIIGKSTLTTAGSVSISNVRLQTNSDFFLAVTGSAASVVTLNSCDLNCSNNTGISFTSSSGSSSINLSNCSGNLGTTGIGLFAHSASGILYINYSQFTNTGLSLTASTCSAGNLQLRYSSFSFTMTTSGTGILLDEFCEHRTFAISTVALTHGGDTTSAMRHCYIDSGTASALTISTTFFVQSCILNSGNANIITGVGNVVYTPTHMPNPGDGNFSITTQTLRPFGPSVRIGCINSGAANTLTVDNASNTASSTATCNVQVAGGTAGDPAYQSTVSGVTTFSWGIDNSDSDAFVVAASASLGTTNVMRVATTGEITYPLQSSFLAQSAAQTDVTGDGTLYTVQYTNEIVDRNSDYDGTSTFTAPVTGLYQFNISVSMSGLLSGHTVGTIALVTTARTYSIWAGSPFAQATNAGALRTGFSILANMTAADTAFVQINVQGSTKVVDITGAGTTASCFSGYLVA